eukprot:5821423-Karenia_brevis.AAC.1
MNLQQTPVLRSTHQSAYQWYVGPPMSRVLACSNHRATHAPTDVMYVCQQMYETLTSHDMKMHVMILHVGVCDFIDTAQIRGG